MSIPKGDIRALPYMWSIKRLQGDQNQDDPRHSQNSTGELLRRIRAYVHTHTDVITAT